MRGRSATVDPALAPQPPAAPRHRNITAQNAISSPALQQLLKRTRRDTWSASGSIAW